MPIFAHKDYGVPGYVNKESLVFAISYSGTTEETIDACLAALDKGAHVFGITSGDQLLDILQHNRVPHYLAPAGRTTRESLAYLLFPVIEITSRLGFIGSQDQVIQECIEVCTVLGTECAPTTSASANVAKQLALSLQGRISIIYGSSSYTFPAALCWKQQINENSKVFAQVETYPDFTHNQIVSYQYPEGIAKSVVAIFLRDHNEPGALQKRVVEAQALLQRSGAEVITIEPQGSSALPRLMYLSYLGDLVSYYLAILNSVDPTPTPAMSQLKDALGLHDTTPGRE